MKELVGKSVVMNQLRQMIERVAPANSRILISGAPGSGKEIVARTIHDASNRSDGPFVVLSAAALTPESVEQELFGQEPGEGHLRKVGALEEAHGGTLYIDEIGEMPRETQAKILRVLVDQSFLRLGGTNRVQVDVRIVSSTSRDLTQAISEGKFREDLFHRLSVVPIRVPALAERRDDIPELIDFFMDQMAQMTGLPRRKISDEARAVLQSHDWPGNLRQLRNNVRAPDDPGHRRSGCRNPTAEMLPQEIGALVPSTPNGSGGERIMNMPLREARRSIRTREYLTAQINRFGGNISRTAEFIGMERSALHRKLKSLEVES